MRTEKKLKADLREWALSPEGWSLPGEAGKYNISTLADEEAYRDKTFYKEQWIKEKDLEQRLIVTYSIKYREHQQNIRESQGDRAKKLLESRPDSIKKARSNDFKRFVKRYEISPEGELAHQSLYEMGEARIQAEQQYDGIYAVCTNLEDPAAEIAKINHSRWEIEESFRLMKSDFKARPVYRSRDDRIKAHFTTCFLALTLFRYLEKRLGEKFSSNRILSELQGMNFTNIRGEGFLPIYKRTDFTDSLHSCFGFRTDYEIIGTKQINNIFKLTKE